jgi:hypothetical protein
MCQKKMEREEIDRRVLKDLDNHTSVAMVTKKRRFTYPDGAVRDEVEITSRLSDEELATSIADFGPVCSSIDCTTRLHS